MQWHLSQQTLFCERNENKTKNNKPRPTLQASWCWMAMAILYFRLFTLKHFVTLFTLSGWLCVYIWSTVFDVQLKYLLSLLEFVWFLSYVFQAISRHCSNTLLNGYDHQFYQTNNNNNKKTTTTSSTSTIAKIKLLLTKKKEDRKWKMANGKP